MDYKKDAIYTYWVQYTTKVFVYLIFLLYNLNCKDNFWMTIIIVGVVDKIEINFIIVLNFV